MANRCLVLGACGQVGHALSRTFAEAYEVTQAVYHTPKAGQLFVDLGDAASVQESLERVNPDVVLIAGAYTYVDGAEAEPELCHRVNVLGPQQAAQYVNTHGGVVLNFSTDHVFDGSRDAHTETDVVHPLNVYSRSKADMETMFRADAPEQHIIIRTAWVYGPDPQQRNFIVRLVNALHAGEPVRVPTDQWGTPTYTSDLAQVALAMVQHGQTGIVHATGPNFVSRIDLARRVCVSFGLNPGLLEEVSTADLQQVARRPLRVRLAVREQALMDGCSMRALDDGLAALRHWYTTELTSVSSGSGATS